MTNLAGLIDGLLTAIASMLGPLSPFTKAVVPAALGLATALVAAIVSLVSHQAINADALIGAGTAEIIAVLGYFLPNLEHKPKAPTKAAIPTKPSA